MEKGDAGIGSEGVAGAQTGSAEGSKGVSREKRTSTVSSEGIAARKRLRAGRAKAVDTPRWHISAQ